MSKNEWYGPARVLKQDGQQVLVKNGNTYIKVHPSRLQFTNKNSNNQQKIQSQENLTIHQIPAYMPQTQDNQNSFGIEMTDREDENDYFPDQ